MGDGADVVRAQGQLDAPLPARRGMASTNIAAIRSKQASVARLSVQTGTGQPIRSAWITS